LGHDSHAHQITSATGCTGTITVPVDGEHDAAANIYGVFDAAYTDNGGLSSHSIKILQPKKRQAEHFGAQSGIQLADHATAEGARTVGFIDNGDWISFQPYLLNNVTQVSARVASGGTGGTIEVRTGSATGSLLGTVTVPVTGGWDTFTTVSANMSAGPATAAPLYLVFKGPAGNLFDLDSFTFTTGTTGPPPTGGVSLRSRANNLYVSADNAGASPLIARAATIGPWETFDLVDLGSGKVALKSRANNMYVCADSGGAASLIANRAAVGGWETFTLVRNGNGTVSLLAQANGQYVVAENAGAQPLIANRTTIGPWEQFDLITN
jgi:hypothetical protein